MLVAVVSGGCSAKPTPGRYDGTVVYMRSLKDTLGTPIGEKTRTAGNGNVTVRDDGADAIALDLDFTLAPNLHCTVLAMQLEGLNFMIAATFDGTRK